MISGFLNVASALPEQFADFSSLTCIILQQTLQLIS